MTQVNIFLCYSGEDLHEDCLEIRNFIKQLNDRYAGRSLQFKLTDCECNNVVPTKEKQREDHQRICNSQLAVFLFYKNIEQYVLMEFDDAYNQFKEHDSPAILTFFRSDGSEPTAEAKKFMNHLDQDIGHYFKTYSDVDELKLYLLMQIMNMGLDLGIEFYDDKANLENEAILPINYLPELKNNVEWKRLKEKQDKLNYEFLNARTNFLENPDSDTASEQYINIGIKLNEVREQLKQLEENIINLTRQAVKDSTTGDLTLRQRKAYQLLEQGNYDEAYTILGSSAQIADINDSKKLKKLTVEQSKNKLEGHVDEILSKIEILKTFVEDPDRFKEIEDLYEVAVKLEEDENLNRKATREYIKYLKTQNEYSRAIQLARQYLNYKDQSGDMQDSRDGKECLASLLCLQASSKTNLEEAETLYREILEIDRSLVEKGQTEESENLAKNCDALAHLVSTRNDMASQAEAESLYREAVKIERRKLAEKSSENDEDYLSKFLDDLATLLALHNDTKSQMESEELYEEALAIRRRLASERPLIYDANLASSCSNLASLFSNQNNNKSREEAEKLYQEALTIRRRLVAESHSGSELVTESPSAYDADYALSCCDLANLFISSNDSGSQTEAEELYREALDIWRRLATDNPSIYGANLAACCDDLAALLCNHNDIDNQIEAEELYREALDIRRKLAIKNPSLYDADLATSYNNLAIIICGHGDADSQAEAEDLYREALGIRRRLAAENPSVYEADLAASCNNLAVFLRSQGGLESLPEAEELYREALDIRRRLATENPSTYDADVAVNCSNLANSLRSHSDAESMTEADELYREMLDIRRNLADENPSIYAAYLASSCNSLAVLFNNNNNAKSQEATEESYRKMLNIKRRMTTENPSIYDADLALDCVSFATILLSHHNDINSHVEAEKLYQESMIIWRRIVAEFPALFDENLVSIFDDLESLLSVRNGMEGREEELNWKLANSTIEVSSEAPDRHLSFSQFADSHVLADEKPKSYNGDKPYIFISYSHKNDSQVLQIIKYLQELGFRIFYDEGVASGSDWDEYIAERMDKCYCACEIFSKAYWESDMCKKELRFINKMSKPNFGVHLQKNEIPKAFQLIRGAVQDLYFYDFSDPQKFMEKLASAEMFKECRSKNGNS